MEVTRIRRALSDGPNSLPLADMPALVDVLLAFDEMRRERWTSAS
jgi:3-deoxy-D-manno-octulosonic acid (KDO) 8-phosphate synthase